MRKILFFLLLFLGLTIQAYPFGKNKVNYYSYDWYVIKTDNYRIYLPEEDLILSNEIAGLAESIYEHHTNAFDYEPNKIIKVVIYHNQIDFQQNNILTEWIGEGTGGFTEFIKGRVVLPYSGDHAYFDHVLAHELTHAFQGLEWGNGSISIYAIRDIDIPLWMVEGMSEYNSIELDNECEMMMADGIIHGILPSLIELSDLYSLDYTDYFYIYKEGQMFYHYLTETYGEEFLSELNASITTTRSYTLALSEVFGKTLAELNSEFFDYLRKRYMPEITELDNLELLSDRLMEEDSYFNMNPVYLSSNEVAFISDRLVYTSIVKYNTDTGRLSRLIKGGFDENFLEFHYGIRNNLSVSDNGVLCFVSRSGGDDVIQLYNMESSELQTINLDFRIINSPEISADGSRILFSAQTNHFFDVFIYDLNTAKLSRLTEDSFYDNQARWIDDTNIVFASNRENGYDSDDMDLFFFDTIRNEITGTIDSGDSDIYPAVNASGNLLAFIRSGVHPSLIIYDLTNQTFYEELVPDGGVFNPAFAAGSNDTVALTVFRENSYNIFSYALSLSNINTNIIYSPDFTTSSNSFFLNSNSINLIEPYRTEFSIDNIIGAFTINTSLGMALIGLMEMSDLLGNHRLSILLDSVIEKKERLLDYINLDVTYYFLKYRSNLGVRFFNYSNDLYEFNTFLPFYDMEFNYYRSWGLYFLYSYPLSTFDRFDIMFGVKGFQYFEQYEYVGTETNLIFSYQNKPSIRISFTHDATLTDYTGPVDGVRFEALFESSFRIFTNSVSYHKAILDYRHYFYLYTGYSLAFRAIVGRVFGPDKDNYPFYIGGFNSVRGYPLWDSFGDSMALLNFEFRFPLIISWMIGFPLPINMPTIWGALFFDIGSAHDWTPDYQPWEYIGDDLYLRDLKAGLGFGLRLVLLPGIKLMVDFATPYEGMGIPSFDEWTTFWQIGVDF